MADKKDDKSTPEKVKLPFVEFLAKFPADTDLSDEIFARNSAPSRDVAL